MLIVIGSARAAPERRAEFVTALQQVVAGTSGGLLDGASDVAIHHVPDGTPA